MMKIRQFLLLSKRVLTIACAAIFLFTVCAQTSYAAISDQQKQLFKKGIRYFDIDGSGMCASISSVSLGAGSPAGRTYSGEVFLDEEDMAQINKLLPMYQLVADQNDVPWQLLAAVHYKENRLRTSNPGLNGERFYDGIFQFRTGEHKGDASGIKYPPGPVSDEEFLNQLTNAAVFLKDKARDFNYPENRSLTARSGPEVIKDVLFSYNGRSDFYKQQAKNLAAAGVGSGKGYEGSVYVMNKFDAARDPSANPSNWKTPWGGESEVGGFLVYSALAGISPSGNCEPLSGPIRERIVSVAQQELALWESGTMKPGTDFHKYSQGRSENWCADFASWVYNQAGAPLKDSNEGNVPGVVTIREIGMKGGAFTYHPVGSGYTPQPGDIVVQQNNASHVNIVVEVKGDRITVIGGNQGGSGDLNGYYTNSRVSKYSMAINYAKNSGFVSPGAAPTSAPDNSDESGN